jgi:hypothetical protein
MGDEKSQGTGIAVSVNESGLEAKVSEGVITGLGTVASWLFPRKDAKVAITQALAQRVAEKIKSGEILNDQEQYFVSLIFEKEAKQLGNRRAIADRVLEVMPEVSEKMKAFPNSQDDGISSEFIERAEEIASTFTDAKLRDMFARVLAGEVFRPGTFSLRTLEVIRLMDQNLAKSFDRFRKLLFDAEFVFDEDITSKLLKKYGVSLNDQIELQDAGLIDDNLGFTMKAGEKFNCGYGESIMQFVVDAEAPDLWIPNIRLTRPAREIARVLPPIIETDYFNEVGRGLAAEFSAKKVTVRWKHETDKEWFNFT